MIEQMLVWDRSRHVRLVVLQSVRPVCYAPTDNRALDNENGKVNNNCILEFMKKIILVMSLILLTLMAFSQTKQEERKNNEPEKELLMLKNQLLRGAY